MLLMKNLHTAGDDHKIRHRWTKASPGPDRGDWLVKVVKKLPQSDFTTPDIDKDNDDSPRRPLMTRERKNQRWVNQSLIPIFKSMMLLMMMRVMMITTKNLTAMMMMMMMMMIITGREGWHQQEPIIFSWESRTGRSDVNISRQGNGITWYYWLCVRTFHHPSCLHHDQLDQHDPNQVRPQFQTQLDNYDLVLQSWLHLLYLLLRLATWVQLWLIVFHIWSLAKILWLCTAGTSSSVRRSLSSWNISRDSVLELRTETGFKVTSVHAQQKQHND